MYTAGYTYDADMLRLIFILTGTVFSFSQELCGREVFCLRRQDFGHIVKIVVSGSTDMVPAGSSTASTATPSTSTLLNDDAKRERSSIEFPYTDLEDAESIAQAIHSFGGGSCEWNTLAGHLKAAPEGGGFRSRMTAARMFGLLRYDRSQVSLTELGHRICDPEQQRGARVDAFLSVPLYSRIYENFSGKVLPPASGLESAMGSLGVVAKQRERARQAFQRSAKRAGFFEFGPDRLVKPHLGQGPASPHKGTEPKSPEPNLRKQGQLASQYDPLIEGLLQRLPAADSDWSMEARKRWLQAALNIFDVMYTDPDGKGYILIEFKDSAK